MKSRDIYVQKLKAKLDEWNAKIDKLAADAEKAETDVKIEYYKRIEDLRSKQESAEKKLKKLKKASGEAWEDLKAGLELALESLEDALKSASSRYN